MQCRHHAAARKLLPQVVQQQVAQAAQVLQLDQAAGERASKSRVPGLPNQVQVQVAEREGTVAQAGHAGGREHGEFGVQVLQLRHLQGSRWVCGVSAMMKADEEVARTYIQQYLPATGNFSRWVGAMVKAD